MNDWIPILDKITIIVDRAILVFLFISVIRIRNKLDRQEAKDE